MNKQGNQEYWNRLLLTELPIPKEEIKEWLKSYAAPYKELMAYYRCAMMEVETKFRVLNEELSLEYDRNPIETIMMKVEVRLRTISMDWWASLEHKFRYKKDIEISEEIDRELKECAEAAAILDRKMESIQRKIPINNEDAYE